MRRISVGGIIPLVDRDVVRLAKRKEGSSDLMAENNIEYPVVRKKFRVTIDVEATLTGGPRGGESPPAPENVPYTRALMERLEVQPQLVDRLLRYRAVDALKQAGKALEVRSEE